MNTTKNFFALIFFLTIAFIPAYGQLQAGNDIDGEAAGDLSGHSVALSSSGKRVAIGAPGNASNGTLSGHVRIFEWNGSSWTKLGSNINGEAADDRSGTSIALSSDGNRIAIGATKNDGNGKDAGHTRVYAWNGSAWKQLGDDINGEAAGDKSGRSVSLSADGSRVAIGARENNGNGDRSGHVKICEWNGSAWMPVGNDIDGEAAGDQSGHSVSLSADGNRIAIGAQFNDGNGTGSGHVRIYSWNGSAWTPLGNDIDGEAMGDNSGWSVSLSADGNRVAIGAKFNDGNGSKSGHARVYSWNGSAWTQLGSDIDGENAKDESGRSVAMSSDGSRVAIGAYLNDGNGSSSGHVRIYAWNGSAWTQAGNDIDGEAAGDISGWSVALSADGTWVAIGAQYNNGNGNSSGHARIYVDAFNYEKSSYCMDEADPTPTVTGLTGGAFSGTTGLAIEASTGKIDLSASQAGTHTVTYTVNGNSGTTKVTVTAMDDASFSYGSATFCLNGSDPMPSVIGHTGGTFTVRRWSNLSWLSINSVTGKIDLSSSTKGNYTIIYTTNGACPQSTEQDITLRLKDNASFNYAFTSYCRNGADPTPTVTGLTGGTFNSSTGLVIDTGSGQIDLSASSPGDHEVTYTTNGTCPQSATQNITLTPMDDASFSYGSTTFCLDESDPVPSVTGITGGTFTVRRWRNHSWLSINSTTGKIDLSSSTKGNYTIIYTTNGACPQSTEQDITLRLRDNASFNYASASYCRDEADPTPTVTGLTGGTFSSSTGLIIDTTFGRIDLSASPPGDHEVTYMTNGICPQNATQNITIIPMDDASFSYGSTSYCMDETDPEPTITVSGGTFSSTPGLAIDVSTGAIDLSASTAGPYTVTYTTNGTCQNSETLDITLTERDAVASFNYAATSYCRDDTDPTPTITGNAGGTFSSASGLTIDSSTGVIGLSTSVAGSYTVTYTTTGTCPQNSTQEVMITDIDGTIHADGLLLTAVQYGATYQWVDCHQNNAHIQGEDSRTFKASESGSYAVLITMNGCTILSECVDLIEDKSFTSEIQVYPNPSSSAFSIDLGHIYDDVELTLYDTSGKLFDNLTFKHLQELTFSIDGAPGIYLLRIHTEGKTGFKRLVKK